MAFNVDGPLLPDQHDRYIMREADQDALTYLQEMNYLLLIAPRQQGVTSLISRLRVQPSLSNYLFAYVNYALLDPHSEANWYQMIGAYILSQLEQELEDIQVSVPSNSREWQFFLTKIGQHAQKKRKKIVIAIDDIEIIDPWAPSFFIIIRSIFNQRPFQPEFNHITFIFTGRYNPQDLIPDLAISPFNIARRIRLPDFTEAQAHDLIAQGDWRAEQLERLVQRIYYWTDGQPYLTQLICSRLNNETMVENVDEVVRQLLAEQNRHLARLRRRVDGNIRLMSALNSVVSGERTGFDPDDRFLFELELFGLIKLNSDGHCIIRNRIYQCLLYGDVVVDVLQSDIELGVVESRIQVSQNFLKRLLLLISSYFSEEELKTLCFNLGVTYENLTAQGRANKARELILYMLRYNRLTELIDECQQNRPFIEWPDALY